ncbi:putative methyltransferase [Aspergillus eucalypticola CBS 122712]|uniref:Methyltransferase n=1 Tax=Aspergillus eucalypticola (strain CBS 122712 / IBT 29274) TaxID=1448314 RepID=A0A317UIF0_ASPEC|nr:putative methyltransferase [Aspergillus eucalypticola CBS 122712]PWY61864.1 putative methyltransferase [Aspergillus eucalypticola CBS 122712]
MPRIPSRTILDAHRQDHLLPLLLQECRSLDLAKSELGWMRNRAVSQAQSNPLRIETTKPKLHQGWRSTLRSMCRARSRGQPLQYILGDQPFGDLDILCRKEVLIPRPETETFTFHAANLISRNVVNASQSLINPHAISVRVIDLCTGTGCISLLLHALVAPHVQHLSIVGIDISTTAIKLARRNLKYNIRQGKLLDRAMADITFRKGNVLCGVPVDASNEEQALGDTPESTLRTACHLDVIISNPPYISEKSYGNGTTARSVRMYEPRIALVPPVLGDALKIPLHRQEDIFYYHILSFSFKRKVRLVMLECGDHSQGERVAALCRALAAQYLQVDDLCISIWPANDGTLNKSAHDVSEPCMVIVQRLGLGNTTTCGQPTSDSK